MLNNQKHVYTADIASAEKKSLASRSSMSAFTGPFMNICVG